MRWGGRRRSTDQLESTIVSDEWRVEVALEAERHGLDLSERLRGRELDDEARKRLGGRVIVTRDGPKVFLYSSGEGEAREAERVVGELLADHELSAEVRLTRWHPIEETWKDASIPLPRTGEEESAERERKVSAEAREVAEEGEFDWEVRVELEGHRATADLAERLEAEGLHVVRRWRYLLVGVLTEEGGSELADRILAEAPPGASARVEPRFSEPTHPLLVFFESR